ncbi:MULTISPECIES: hypothetical protein [unclassified Streptomyces]|uniref:hypothetical protein n=1 Tax=unclassified Streptomyces TaxID=2593676 RepID=UPI0035E10A92
MTTPDPGTGRQPGGVPDHRARARAVRPRLIRAAADTHRSSRALDAESAVVLVEAGTLALAADLAAAAGTPPPGLSGRAALGWQAATDAIVTALRRAADHQGARVEPDPAPGDLPAPAPYGPPPAAVIDWSAEKRP